MTWEIIRRGDQRAPAAVRARPSRWDVKLCRDRLLEAADIDRRQTGIKMPRKSGNSHLTTAPHTLEERADWIVDDIDVDHFEPTPAERARAEKVLGWLRMFTAREAELLHALKDWINVSITRRNDTLSAAATRALTILAGRLNEAAVPAF